MEETPPSLKGSTLATHASGTDTGESVLWRTCLMGLHSYGRTCFRGGHVIQEDVFLDDINMTETTCFTGEYSCGITCFTGGYV